MPKIPMWLAWLCHSLAVALASISAANIIPATGTVHTVIMVVMILLSSLGFGGAYQNPPYNSPPPPASQS